MPFLHYFRPHSKVTQIVRYDLNQITFCAYRPSVIGVHYHGRQLWREPVVVLR